MYLVILMAWRGAATKAAASLEEQGWAGYGKKERGTAEMGEAGQGKMRQGETWRSRAEETEVGNQQPK